MQPPYDGPGIYSVHVGGRVDEAWADHLGGLTVTIITDEGGRPVTVLKGYLPDQAALMGVLNTLYNNRYPVIFVQYLRPYINGASFTPNQDQCRA